MKDLVELHDDTFFRSWSEITEEFSTGYTAGDPKVVEMVDGVMPTNFKTLNYRDYSEEYLLKFFDGNIEDDDLNREREKRFARALKESFSYLAYHQARYRGDFAKQFAGTLRLTVAPKEGSFGIRMLNSSSKLLPYYGYIVKRADCFTIEYRMDVPSDAKAVYLRDGSTLSPFFFEME